MSIENIKYGRVAQAVAIILGVSLAVFFAVMMAFMFVRISQALGDLDSSATEDEQQDRIQEETDVLMEEFQDGSSTVTNIMAIQWGLMAVVTLLISLWAARRNATSPAQATGYGVMIGFGVLVLYGLLCMCSVPTDWGIKLAFMIAIPAAGAVGGQLAGGRLGPKTTPVPGLPTASGSIPQAQAPSGDVAMYYNMGVQAALGGRREEARQHFSRVLQAQPRNIAAWLQLANLADTPESAWQYVQQARSINPSDPAVLQAVNIIWPQVAQRAAQQGPPVSQTPGAESGRSVPPVPGSALEDITDMTPAAPAPSTPPSAGITEAPTVTDLPGMGTPPPEVTEAPTATYDVSAYTPSSFDTAGSDADAGNEAADQDDETASAGPPPPPPPPPESEGS